MGQYTPLETMITYTIPKTPSKTETKTEAGDIFGVAINGVPFETHDLTWAFDNCLGHSGKDHQYHYHLAPICLLETLGAGSGLPVNAATYWQNSCDSEDCEFPETVDFPSPIIGYALDGHPIFAFYDVNGDKMVPFGEEGATLDECNGKTDADGNYGYYLTPFTAPTCFMGTPGTYTVEQTDKKCMKPSDSPSVCVQKMGDYVFGDKVCTFDPTANCNVEYSQNPLDISGGQQASYAGALAVATFASVAY